MSLRPMNAQATCGGEIVMMKKLLIGSLLGACSMVTPANAGEVTGSGRNLPVNGHSLCAYSGLNDTPDGLSMPDGQGGFIEIDPGGRVQSYGYFKAQRDFLRSPNDPDARASFEVPAVGCNGDTQ
jgi:hypothetical protein